MWNWGELINNTQAWDKEKFQPTWNQAYDLPKTVGVLYPLSNKNLWTAKFLVMLTPCHQILTWISLSAQCVLLLYTSCYNSFFQEISKWHLCTLSILGVGLMWQMSFSWSLCCLTRFDFGSPSPIIVNSWSNASPMQKFRKAPQFLLCQYQPKNQPFLPFPLFSFGMCDTPVFCSFTTISCMSRPKDFQNHKAVLALENCISNVLAFIKWAFW